MKRKVLVIGGGLAGMVTALELAGQGIEVYLVERAAEIGGKAINYCCKATNRCNKCGACLVPLIKTRVEEAWGIKLILNSEVKSISGEAGCFKVKVHFLTGSRGLNLGAETTLEVEAIVIATGFDLIDTGLKGEYGYGRHRGVITAFELEKAIKEKGSLQAAYGAEVNRVGFIQCVGSRDITFGNPNCSRICCRVIGKLVKLIKHETPKVAVDIFYTDLQSNEKTCHRDNTDLRYIRAIPAKILRYPNEYLTVCYAESPGGQVVEGKYDLVVLAQGLLPARGLENMFSDGALKLNSEGFLAEQEHPGIFAAGACTGPMDIHQTITHAQGVTGKVLLYLSI